MRRPRSYAGGALVVVICLVVLLPVFAVLRASFQYDLFDSTFTLSHYTEVYSDRNTRALIARTLFYAVSSAALTTALGLMIAWLVTATDVPCRESIKWITLVPLILPLTIQSVAWLLLLNPSNGFINHLIHQIPSFADVTLDLYTMSGMIFVTVAHFLPVAFMILAAAIKGIDGSMEEAARTCGAGPLRVITSTTIKLLVPATASVFLLLTIICIESFEIPAFIGLPGHISVLSSEIYSNISERVPPNYGGSAAFGSIGLLLALPLIYGFLRVMGHQGKYATVGGKGGGARVTSLGMMRWPIFVVLALVTIVTSVLPTMVVVMSAFFDKLNAQNLPSLATATLGNFRVLAGDMMAMTALRNSFVVAIIAATVATLLALTVAWYKTKVGGRRRFIVDYATTLPYALPGPLLAVGFIFALVKSPLYKTLWIIGLAYCVKYLSFGARTMVGYLSQMKAELEEAARVSGASNFRVWRSILVPLLTPGMLATWTLLVIFFVREFSMSILLYGPSALVSSIVIFTYWESGRVGVIGAMAMVIVAGTLVILAIGQLAQLGRRNA